MNIEPISLKRPLWIEILVLSGPLILSMTGLTLMQFIDALFLSWYSADAIAAVVPAGMASWLLISVFQGTVMYGSTFVAHYIGAGQSHRAASAIWQCVYIALISGCLVFSAGFFSTQLFALVGHSASVQPLEAIYFKILSWGGFLFLLGSAWSGYFSGKGDTRLLMIAQMIGFVVNAILDWILIFGKLGFPELGVTGAAIATVAAQGFTTALLAIKFLQDGDKVYSPWRERKFIFTLFKRIIRFGFPSGLRFGFEALAWTSFILIIGRIGTTELAASNIAFRINGFAFFPIIGLGQAVNILIGQSQGRQLPALSRKITHTGIIISEFWMILASLIFILFPKELYMLFEGNTGSGNHEIVETGILLLKFVALYSLLDACNIIYSGALQAAGDTRWTMIVSLIGHTIFLALLIAADQFKWGLWAEWGIATVFVMTIAFVWVLRFHSKKWESIKVIEPVLD